MHKIAQEKGGSFKSKEEQKQALGKAYGICRSDFTEDIALILDDLSVSSYWRKGKYVRQHERAGEQHQVGIAKILYAAISELKRSVKGLEKDLAKAFKNAKPEEYKQILTYINDKKSKIEKLRNELNRRGFTDMEDYPVREYTRKGKKVKAHTRGEAEKEEVALAKIRLSDDVSAIINDILNVITDEKELERLAVSHENENIRAAALLKLERIRSQKAVGIKKHFHKIRKKQEADETKFISYDKEKEAREKEPVLRAIEKSKKVEQFTGYRKSKEAGLGRITEHEWIRKLRRKKYGSREDATVKQILGGGIKEKAKEKRERSIFFRPFRPLETLHEVTQTAGKQSSSNVVGMEYSQGMLKVTFNWEKLGEVEYGYDVGPDFYERMAKAPSKGKFVWSALRGKTPGYVIDRPSRTTPGGVGGSLVPYTKLTKRKIQGKEFDKLQKFYAKQLGGKVKVVAHMPFVRKKQKRLSRESKPFKRSPQTPDFNEFIIDELSDIEDFHHVKSISQDSVLSDSVRVKTHTRTRGGKTYQVKEHDREGERAKQITETKAQSKILKLTEQKLYIYLKATNEAIQKAKDPKKKAELQAYRMKLAEHITKVGAARVAVKGRKQILKKLCASIQGDLLREDDIPVKGHYAMRGGKRVFIKEHKRTGKKAEELKKKIREKAIKPIAIPEAEKKKRKGPTSEEIFQKWLAERRGEKPPEKKEPEKKKAPSKRVLSPEEKRRREIEAQAKKMKAVPPPEPREEATRRLIEQTGMTREEAEKQIAKRMGLSPEQAKKKAETKQKEEQFKVKHTEYIRKLNVLNELNKKIQSTPLKHILQLFVKSFMLVATGKDPKAVVKRFGTYYDALKKERKLDQRNKERLLLHIDKMRKELLAMTKTKEDALGRYYCNLCKSHHKYSSELGKAHLKKSMAVKASKKLSKVEQKEKRKEKKKEIKATYKKAKEKVKELKKKEKGKPGMSEALYKAHQAKYMARGAKLFKEWKDMEDYEYVSRAVDQCARQKMAEAGGKGDYDSFVRECIVLIGIARRRAGLPRRSATGGGTAREVRRGERRGRTQYRGAERRIRIRREEIEREAQETSQREWREWAEELRRREQQNIARNSVEEGNARRYLRSISAELRNGNLSYAEIALSNALAHIDQIVGNEPLRRELLNLHEQAHQEIEYFKQIREVETLRQQRRAREEEEERRNALVQQKHALERLLGEGNLQDARRILEFMESGVSGLNEGEVRQRWEAQLRVFERRISRAEEERTRTSLSAEELRRREQLARTRAEVRHRRQERNPRIRILREGEGSVSGLNEPEGGVIHIEIPQEQQPTITPEEYHSRYMRWSDEPPPSWARLTPPAGMRQTRRGYWRSDGVWVNPVFRTSEQISQARVRRREARQRYRTTSRGSTIRETPAEREARRERRQRRGPKMRWRTRVTFNGRVYKSLNEIKKSDLRSGQHLELNPIAKKDYDFENPDFNPRVSEREGNRRRIRIRKGEVAGRASFTVNYHSRTGVYLYLGTLKMRADFRGRGASGILKPALMWADRENLIIGGSPSPIGRSEEVAPAHLSREEQARWAHSNSRDLNNFYRRLEGEPNWEYGGTFARFPHPERIGGRASDLIRVKMDQAKNTRLIFFNRKYLEEIDGYLFYYDPNEDQFYYIG